MRQTEHYLDIFNEVQIGDMFRPAIGSSSGQLMIIST
jgi:hypothetical protein